MNKEGTIRLVLIACVAVVAVTLIGTYSGGDARDYKKYTEENVENAVKIQSELVDKVEQLESDKEALLKENQILQDEIWSLNQNLMKLESKSESED